MLAVLAEKLAVKDFYHCFGGFVAAEMIFILPAQQLCGLALYFRFHFAHRRIGKVDAAGGKLEAEEFPRLMRRCEREFFGVERKSFAFDV